MRNVFPVNAVFDRAYKENVTLKAQNSTQGLPLLLKRVRPVHELVRGGRARAGMPAIGRHDPHGTKRIAGRPHTGHCRADAVWNLERAHGKDDNN